MTSTLNSKELSILEIVSANASVSQRELSQGVGLSLGVTNALLQKLIQAEFLVVRQTNKKRREYHLTQSGAQQRRSNGFLQVLRIVRAYRDLERRILDLVEESLHSGMSEIIVPQDNEIAESLVKILEVQYGDSLLIKRMISDSSEKSLLLRFGTAETPVNFKGRVVDVLQYILTA